MALLAALALAIAARGAEAPPPPPPPPPSYSASPSSAAGEPALPPGWTYGVIVNDDGDRLIAPLPPGVEVPVPRTVADPVQQARGRLAMLRIALETYQAGALAGLHQYPQARSLGELAGVLEHQELLPANWQPGAPVFAFEATAFSYHIALQVGAEIVAIQSLPVRNPYSMLLVLPHRL